MLVIPAPRLRAGLADAAGPEPGASMPLSTVTAAPGFTGRPRGAGTRTDATGPRIEPHVSTTADLDTLHPGTATHHTAIPDATDPAATDPDATDPDATDLGAPDLAATDLGAADLGAVGRAAVDAVAGEDPATVAALAAAGGDPTAQHHFVRLTQTEVWRFVAGLVDPASADDLTQETYLRALRALPAFEGRSTARTWLLGIARRTCADHIRMLQRRRRFETAAPEDSAERPGSATGDHAAWHSAVDLLRELPEDRRAAFLLTQLAGLSYAEVAEVEGVPVGTIRSRVARARMQLLDAVRAARSS